MATPREILGTQVTQSQISSFFTDYMGVFNVKSYGAVGDGVTNDTSNINACMADASTHSAAAIYYPPGTYLVSSSLFSTNFDNLYHWGDGASFSGSTTIIAQLGLWINNRGNVPEISGGAFASRPDASTTREGYIYISSDTAEIFQVISAAWSRISSYSLTQADSEIGRIYKVWW